MKPRNMLIASAVAVTMLAAGCSSGGSGSGTTRLKLEKTNITVAAFPAVDAVRLQRVVSAMSRFGLLPKNTAFKISSMISG
jgi:ABC-type phosphate/phosphonate transport system substrate-binding protein